MIIYVSYWGDFTEHLVPVIIIKIKIHSSCEIEDLCTRCVSCRSPRWCTGYPRILLALVLEFDFQRRGDILSLFARMHIKKKNYEKGSTAENA